MADPEPTVPGPSQPAAPLLLPLREWELLDLERFRLCGCIGALRGRPFGVRRELIADLLQWNTPRT